MEPEQLVQVADLIHTSKKSKPTQDKHVLNDHVFYSKAPFNYRDLKSFDEHKKMGDHIVDMLMKDLPTKWFNEPGRNNILMKFRDISGSWYSCPRLNLDFSKLIEDITFKPHLHRDYPLDKDKGHLLGGARRSARLIEEEKKREEKGTHPTWTMRRASLALPPIPI